MTPAELKAIRTRLGLTQAGLGELLGFTGGKDGPKNRVSELERGVRPITERTERLLGYIQREEERGHGKDGTSSV